MVVSDKRAAKCVSKLLEYCLHRDCRRCIFTDESVTFCGLDNIWKLHNYVSKVGDKPQK